MVAMKPSRALGQVKRGFKELRTSCGEDVWQDMFVVGEMQTVQTCSRRRTR